MAEIEVTDDSLTVHVTGVDRVLAFTSRLDIPLAHVVGAELGGDGSGSWWHGVRVPGTDIPGVVTAGSFLQHGELVFWDVHRSEKSVAIQLRHERYTSLVVGVEEPEDAVARIRAAVADLNS
jgi:hypothetical protein